MSKKNKSLFDDYKKFERILKNNPNNKILDTSTEDFLAPTTLIPLLIHAIKNDIQEFHTHKDTRDYVLHILKREQIGNNTPFRMLPKTKEAFYDESISKEVGNLITEDYAGNQSINFVISELVNNIYDHTSFEKKYASQGYIYAQLYPSWKKLDITVYDDGLSIPGRFDKSNVDYKDDCHAIEKALTRFTTIKNRQYERGNGLGSCMKLIKANKGSALIVSRKGCLEIDEKRKIYHYHNLNNEELFKGTLITLRFRDNPVNFYEALDDGYIHGTPYKYTENYL